MERKENNEIFGRKRRENELFPKQEVSYVGILQGGHVWCLKVVEEINNGKAQANCIHSVCNSSDDLWFRVTKFDKLDQGVALGVYRVHLRTRTCDCVICDALCYPCAYAIADCMNFHLHPMGFVDDVYKL
ncbi:hypothetical protein PVK06_034817 [Gossypium arboreum]|uniref:Uncharacterized protein n=1 Tax=Gossypium arboreum TaxID=29729 RepID=A0ABR0NF99_GOSAR|nr:hypothetical protein PVK06_034817 [Gossypium arboreum]